VRTLPEDQLDRHPVLAVAAAAAAMLVGGRRLEQRRLLALADRDGRRAVELTGAGADELLTGALAGYARALFFAGECGRLDSARGHAEQATPDGGMLRCTARRTYRLTLEGSLD
jgi:hypothetical protein